MKFAERLNRALINAHKTQTQLASELGYSKSTINNWIAGKSFPSIDVLQQICIILQVSPDDLLGWISSDEDDFHGIRWVQDVPHFLTDEQRKEIATGVALFKKLLQGHTLDELRRDPQFDGFDDRTLMSTVKTAIRSNCLRITDIPRNNQLEQNLRTKFSNLRNVYVAAIPSRCYESQIRAECVAFLAATILPTLRGKEVIGFGSGYTMVRMAEISVPTGNHFNGTTWIPLMASAANNFGSHSANTVALIMSTRHPGSTALLMPYPSPNGMSEGESRQLAEITRLLPSVNALFVSVNGTDRKRTPSSSPSPIDQFKAADYFSLGHMTGLYKRIVDLGLHEHLSGEFLGLFLDTKGQPILLEETKKHFIQIELSTFQDLSAMTWIVAAGTYKAKAVLMLLKNQLANSLVIDAEIAEYLLSNYP